MVGDLDWSGQPGIDLHEKRHTLGVTTKLHLTQTLELQRSDETHRSLEYVPGHRHALPDDGGTAERWGRPMLEVGEARPYLVVRHEQRDTLPGPFLLLPSKDVRAG